MAFQAKRRFKRNIERDAVKIFSSSGIEYATYEDLSAGGLKLWMDRSVPDNSVMEIEFDLRSREGKNLETIRAIGRVVRSTDRSKGFEVGVQFTNLSDATRSAIERRFDSGEGPF